jgi:hypothetical protein
MLCRTEGLRSDFCSTVLLSKVPVSCRRGAEGAPLAGSRSRQHATAKDGVAHALPPVVFRLRFFDPALTELARPNHSCDDQRRTVGLQVAGHDRATYPLLS